MPTLDGTEQSIGSRWMLQTVDKGECPTPGD